MQKRFSCDLNGREVRLRLMPVRAEKECKRKLKAQEQHKFEPLAAHS